MALLRILIAFTLVAGVLAVPFAAAVVVAKGVLVEEAASPWRRAGLWLAVAFPAAALLAAWQAWRRRDAPSPRAAWGWLALVPGWAVASLGLLLVAQATAPRAEPAARPPDDLRALAAFLAAPDAPLLLDLRGRGLTTVPPAVFEAAALRELDLRDNRLAALPDQLAAMPALRVVRVGGNPLSQEEVRRFSLMLTMRNSRLVIAQ
ncbi:MAG: leucine-rich repeat domain-containing protein [Rubritepida sp.]|nr:leucine-rich repeat domain-containing protein [Rubritepida sp.]